MVIKLNKLSLISIKRLIRWFEPFGFGLMKALVRSYKLKVIGRNTLWYSIAHRSVYEDMWRAVEITYLVIKI